MFIINYIQNCIFKEFKYMIEIKVLFYPLFSQKIIFHALHCTFTTSLPSRKDLLIIGECKEIVHSWNLLATHFLSLETNLLGGGSTCGYNVDF